ncbi:MAG: hypothetical protein HYR68_08995 [Burkholderiales bacterium]|nr:hypothetical protein [Burkholderiales bacterium]MBI3728057.1 hypothetical protein [Burkholderiales bacterium]
MSAHYLALIVCSLLMYAQYTCAQEIKTSPGTEIMAQQTSLSKEISKELLTDESRVNKPGDASVPDEKTAPAQAADKAELNGPPVPPVTDAQLVGRRGNTQVGNGQDLYTRVTKEYYSQSANLPGKQEKPGTLSRFGLRYSQSGNDHLWLEYRFSEKGALRLRGAAHRGVRVLAVFEY